MADNNPRRQKKGAACQYCFDKKRGCQFPDENSASCEVCSEAGLVCVPRKPASKPQKKRKNELSHSSHTSSTKSFRIDSQSAQRPVDIPEDSLLVLPQKESSSNNCGICHYEERDSSEKKSDIVMLEGDGEACKVVDVKRRVRNNVAVTKQGASCEPSAAGKHEPPLIQGVYLSENRSGMPPFALTRDQKFHGFEENTIKVLLRDLSELIYHYDRQVFWMLDTLHEDPTNTYAEAPLKEWHTIDVGCEFAKGREWFELENYTDIDPASHLPITAALRLLLKASPSQSLAIHPTLEKITFSQVHMSLIYWFIFDVIQNKRDIYELPNMKPLRAMMSAITNFGDARWEQMGQQVLREIQLRTWQKDMFKDALIENIELQNDLIKRFEAFFNPLLCIDIDIPLRSTCRAAIIRKSIELWSYLQAVGGELMLIHPDIGDDFDTGVHSELNLDDEEGSGIDHREVSWVLCPGFYLKEETSDGSSRQLTIKALVVTS